MNPPLLLKHFDRVSEAPDAVPSLRRFVLELAVRGKLVRQDQNDEPASELLKRIRAEKTCLANADGIRREKHFSPVDRAEVPFDIPTSWEWARVRQVTSDRGQTTPSRDFTYIDVGAIDKSAGRLVCPEVVSAGDAPSRARKLVCKGDVLYSCVRPYLLNVAVIETDIRPAPIASTAFAVLNGFGLVLPKYLWAALRSPFMVECVEAKMRGQAYPAINDADFAQLPFPLPPLAEQHRIVGKVDELMRLFDRLESAQEKRERRRDLLATVSLNRLTEPSSETAAFREHVRFELNQLARVVTQQRHVNQLRRTILSLAVHGKLAAQDPSDEPALKQLRRIRDEKDRLIGAGTLRRQRPIDPIAPEELPFDIPAAWAWTRIGTCSISTEYGTSVKSDNAEDGVPVLKMGDIRDGRVVLGGQKKVPRSIEDLPALFLNRFDLLYNRTNSAELVGKTGIYMGDDEAYTFASYLIRIRFINNLVSPLYVNLAMNAPYFRESQIVPELQQQCGQANVNGTKLRRMLIPLPPLAEQHRIVAAVNALMALCDQVEAHMARAQLMGRQLLDAVLLEALTSVTLEEVLGPRRKPLYGFSGSQQA